MVARIAAVVALLAVGAAAQVAAQQASPARVNQLEQDLRDLRRQVDAQQRRIDDLERAAAGAPAPRGPTGARSLAPARPAAPSPAAGATPAPWLKAANWESVRPGMAELDVIALLGPPSSMRVADDGRRRTLFYVLEIGSSGFLAGNVVLEEARVVALETPRLR